MPQGQDTDPALIALKFFRELTVGKSPDALTNIAGAVGAWADETIKDDDQRKAFDQKMDIAAAQYAMDRLSEDRDYANALDIAGATAAAERAADLIDRFNISETEAGKIKDIVRTNNQNIRDGAESIELGRKLILALEGQEGQEELTGAKGLVRALKENYNSFMNSADYKSGNLTPQDVQIQLKKLTLQSFGTFLGEDQSANSISDRDMRLFQLAVFGTDTLDDSLVNLLFANPERIQQSLGDLVISLEDRSNVSLQDNASYLKRINEGIAVSGPTPYDATYFNLGPDSDYTYNEETNRYQLTSNANS